ncbi:ankyrin repeat domain-containing protein [Oxalobacter sp. OttesenSCG-928-P03]|nr:ankyrin repeat domain-containing protein [Oxalobacter sp. OttesenSCG-928-P03]
MIRRKLVVAMTGLAVLSFSTASAYDMDTPVQLTQNRINPVAYHSTRKAMDVDAIFMSALRAGQYEKAKALLAAGANPNQKGEYNKTTLMLALQSHRADIELVRALLKTGNVNQRDNYNECAITIACSNGVSVEIIKLLLESGADKNARCVHGHNLLFITLFARIENSQLVKYLLSIGFDPNEKHGDDGYPLQLALKTQKMSSARALVRAGADLSILSHAEMEKLEPHLKRMKQTG